MDKEEMLIRKLADHSCGAYLVRVIEGIIHNLNGPFQILYIRSEQLAMNIKQLQEGFQTGKVSGMGDLVDKMRERIESVLKGLDDLNNQHLHLTSGMIVEKRSVIQPIKIDDLIKDTLFLLNANMLFKHKVEKVYHFGENLPTVFGRYSEFGVIILNIVQNALEAMVDTDERRLEIETSCNDRMVTIKISDTGCGIPRKNQKHIFSPFFTTKKDVDYEGKLGDNMGLGLSIVEVLIKDYGGTITCESVPGATTFTLNIPAGKRTKD
jgi:signal transduction histidine kinase